MSYFIGPTVLVKAGSEPILDARALAGGDKGVTYGDYFWLGAGGPVLVDLDEPVKRAGTPLLPHGKSLYGLVYVNFQTLTATLPLRDSGWALCCSDDRIVVQFSIVKGEVSITGAKYVAAP